MLADVHELGDELKRSTLMCFHAGIDSAVRNYALHLSSRTFAHQLFCVLGVQHRDTILLAAASCERRRIANEEAREAREARVEEAKAASEQTRRSTRVRKRKRTNSVP